MPGPVAPLVIRAVAAAAGAEPDALNVQQLRSVIAMVDGARGVAEVGQKYAVDEVVVSALPAGYHQMVAAAVARANNDPLVAAARTARPQAAGVADWGPKIQEWGEKLGKTVDVINHVKTLVAGAVPRAYWWGVTVDLDHAAAEALVALVKGDVNAFLAVLVPFVPQAAAVLAVTTPGGLALGAWISAANTAQGARLELLMWIVPWVEAR
jgi:hypothetical protein